MVRLSVIISGENQIAQLVGNIGENLRKGFFLFCFVLFKGEGRIKKNQGMTEHPRAKDSRHIATPRPEGIRAWEQKVIC